MRIRILGALATVLAGTGLAAADPGAYGSMSVFDKWRQPGVAVQSGGANIPVGRQTAVSAPPMQPNGTATQSGCASCAAAGEPCCAPTHTFPAPKVFRAEVDRPTYLEGKPLAPVHLLRAVPPSVELVAARPPALEMVRAAPPNIELVGAVPPPIPLFRLQPGPLGSAPPVQFPAVRLFRIPQPPAPCCPPPVCAPCCATASH